MEAAFSNIPISEKLKTYSLVCIYLAVNSLFIIKYGEQYNSFFPGNIFLLSV